MKNKLIFFLIGVLVGAGIMYFAQSRQKYSSLGLCKYYSTKAPHGMAVYVVTPLGGPSLFDERNAAWRLVNKKYPGKFNAATLVAKTGPPKGWCELIIMPPCYRRKK